MNKRISYTFLIFLAIVAAFTNIVFALTISEESLAKAGLSKKDFMAVTRYYYQNPQPEKLILVFKFMLAQKESSALDPIGHLIATVAQKDKTILNKMQLIEKEYSGLQKEAVQKIILKIKNYIPASSKTIEDIDLLWDEFIATGNVEPVKKVIGVLGYTINDIDLNAADFKKRNLQSKQKALDMLQHVARWSLIANKQNEKVYEVIQKESVAAKGQLKEKLYEILNNKEPI